MKKFAFVNIPSQELERPPAAAAALSACVRAEGWDCQIFDFNLFLHGNVSTEEWQELEQYWRCKKLSLEETTKIALDTSIDLFLDQIYHYDPDMLGLSVFSRFSVVPAHVMLTRIRERLACTVVIGGNGSYAWPGSLPNIDQHLNAATFADYAKQTGIIDHFVMGDGEDAIRELLKGNLNYGGIDGNPEIQIRNLDALPLPEYTGIEPKNYYFTHEPGIFLTATRGCVRKCTFCNVPEIWPKFSVRSADSVLSEIIRGRKEYGVNLFHFTDSLLNGNMKIWRGINKKIIDAKMNDPDLESVQIIGQFICRPRHEQTEEDWKLMADAGVKLLVTGLESFSPHVRAHMGKNHSNDDIDFHIKQSAKFGIRNVMLMFVGYPVETQEDHEYNIEFLHRYQKYAKAGTIHMVRWGYTGMFHGDTSKIEKSGNVKLIVDPDFAKKFNNLPQGIRDIALGFGWINELNPTLTLRERIRRRLELHTLSVELGWPQTRSREELQILYNILHNLNQNRIVKDDFESLESLLDFH